MNDRIFSVTHNYRSYAVMGNENTTLETVWNSQKCWFMTGSEVTIEDDMGNKKTFRKE